MNTYIVTVEICLEAETEEEAKAMVDDGIDPQSPPFRDSVDHFTITKVELIKDEE